MMAIDGIIHRSSIRRDHGIEDSVEPDMKEMPTRVQQLGLLILLTALVVYVLIRVGW